MTLYYSKLKNGNSYHVEATSPQHARQQLTALHGNGYWSDSVTAIPSFGNRQSRYGTNDTGYYRTIKNRNHYT